MTTTEYDYIIVGGGSAGSIVAAELAANPKRSVLLLEWGDPTEDNPETLETEGYKRAFVNERLMFDRFSTPQSGCDDRRLFMGSGKGMGGSGSINAMVYTRGGRLDYEQWPSGWRWDDVQADFTALETRLRPRRRNPTVWTEACIAAWEEAGFHRSEDLNNGDLEGMLGYEWMSFEGEQRRSSFVSFLKERVGSPNLRIETRARVHRIVFEERRAVGVEYRQGDTLHRATAKREIVLASGAIETPRLLQLSGIGPAEVLRSAGVPVIVDAPKVGRNFHDHPNVQVFNLGKEPVDCNYPQLYGFNRAGAGSTIAPGQADSCYVFYPARSSFREGALKLLPGIVLPKGLYEKAGLVKAMRGAISAMFARSTVQRFVEKVWAIVVVLGKPKSRGSVTIASSRPEDDALVDPAYFVDPEDMDAMVRGVRLARRIASTKPAREWGARELMPGARVKKDAGIARFIRKNVMTTYHYAGSCGMTEDGAGAVDTRLKLRGVTGIRIADASVIPTAPVSAPNAPCMLIGMRAARFIAES